MGVKSKKLLRYSDSEGIEYKIWIDKSNKRFWDLITRIKNSKNGHYVATSEEEDILQPLFNQVENHG